MLTFGKNVLVCVFFFFFFFCLFPILKITFIFPGLHFRSVYQLTCNQWEFIAPSRLLKIASVSMFVITHQMLHGAVWANIVKVITLPRTRPRSSDVKRDGTPTGRAGRGQNEIAKG